jgi:cytochrome P450
MSEHPEAMAKAQKEIDSVVGLDRLPTFADRENLPYVEALFNECIRYGVAVPLCMFSLPVGHVGILTVSVQLCPTG